MIAKITHELTKVPNYNRQQYLLAFSGGIDSVVLAEIFKSLSLDFALAHCNFKLRGKESDQDQSFVENYAQANQIPLFVKVCDLSQNDENTQIAARNARYEWFDELLQKHSFDYLITAHHLNDSVETFFINLMRGSGLKGLTGIQSTGKIIRPMLGVSRKEIEKFATENQLSWREDSSNASDKYRRNFIRHQIIPAFEKLQPGFLQAMQKTMGYLQQSESVVQEWFEKAYRELVEIKNDSQILDLQKFENFQHKELFLHEWLSAYGFSDRKAIANLTQKAQSGKYLLSDSHRLYRHQNYLILEPVTKLENGEYLIEENQNTVEKPIALSLKRFTANEVGEQYKKASKNEVYLDLDQLKFPLRIRKWQAGDYFYPLGMKGKKKVSDFFKDEKISLSEKEKIWLICDRNHQIVWIAGKRADNRYKISDQTKRILYMKLK